MSNLWVDNRHPDYDVEAYQRQFARDQFTGDALLVSQIESSRMADPAAGAGKERTLSPFMDISGIRGRKRLSEVTVDFDRQDRIRGPQNGTYLRRRALGESADAFRERAFITRFPAHMSTLIEAYVGGIKAVESEAKRSYGEPLGDPADTGSIFFRMWHDIDGTGRNWGAATTRMMTNLIVDDVFWSFTELGSAEHPRTHIIDPQRVVDWHDEDGIPVWLLLEETRMFRPDMHKKAEMVRMYTEYDVNGWRRWRVVEGDDQKESRSLVLDMQEEWAFPFWSTPDRQRKRIPFTRMRLSDVMGRYVGYQMALDHNMLYNLLSDARWNFRVINHPRLKLREGDEQKFDKALAKIAEGANGLLGDWEFISPDANNGATAYKVFSDEVRQYYVTNHQRMNGSNIERSATEIAYNEATGRTSFLSILTDLVDECENDWMFLSSQLMAPERPEEWLNARVERSRSFRPIDIQSLAQSQSNSLAALGNLFDAETALEIARHGVTDDVIRRVREAGSDQIVTEEL